MGVVNVTPDSFSDGGRYLDPDAAIAHGLELLREGADVLDIGGESTRPGATRPLVAEELGRVVPVIAGLAAEGAVVSVDTMRAEVAEAAVAAGAAVVNDVSGGLADAAMLPCVASSGVTYVAMHWRAHSDRMSRFTDYGDDVVATVRSELADRVESALSAGLAPDRLVLDPGLGFAKTADQSWQLLAAVSDLSSLGHPLLVGASRKSFLGSLLADADGTPRPVDDRETAHVAVLGHCMRHDVWGVRVHDVRAACDTFRAQGRLGWTDERGAGRWTMSWP
ncbi:dihydropteroate synthase [Nocardioides sp. CBS4Y-1]|uniref:dihydropteroate synthase n=2 Tax=Nocardioides acrostichi TaxID=2784339 RepID=A0A930V0V5_9ACTN|nr:dihydropteroate synthase [Nocardioides acrostichi]MBF4162625.1 dihydropteroate synthase [Nocardioides acrostichi]